MSDLTPASIQPLTRMDEPNSSIPIYNGKFKLITENAMEYEFQGSIDFKWLPNPSVKFRGLNIGSSSIGPDGPYARLIIDGVQIGDATIMRTMISGDESVAGIVKSPVMGDRTIAVNHIHFEVPNLRNFFGDSVRQTTLQYRGRITFEAANSKFTIDKRPDFDSLEEGLKDQGGYLTLYSGVLTNIQSKISFVEAEELLRSFGYFLTFINGRRCFPVLRKGVFERNVVWTDYTPYWVDFHKQVSSWPMRYDIEGLSELWPKFYELLKEEDSKDCLTTVIHWYVEANGNSGLVEGSIAMIQNALELLYSWQIVEVRGIVLGDDSNNLSAANKIRQLLNLVDLPNQVHSGFKELDDYLEVNKVDGPELFARVRNSIVHANKDKRTKLKNLPKDLRAQVLHLGIWYVELVLLYVLDYKGQYLNRCSNEEEEVPWSQ